jgi:hypothetical protein
MPMVMDEQAGSGSRPSRMNVSRRQLPVWEQQLWWKHHCWNGGFAAWLLLGSGQLGSVLFVGDCQ